MRPGRDRSGSHGGFNRLDALNAQVVAFLQSVGGGGLAEDDDDPAVNTKSGEFAPRSLRRRRPHTLSQCDAAQNRRERMPPQL